jgi:hypothetical protein
LMGVSGLACAAHINSIDAIAASTV